jgi:hypothetical protein
MASDTVYDAVRAYLIEHWIETPINFENGDRHPEYQEFPPNPPAPFVQFEITGTFYGQQSIGADEQADNRWDEEGVIWMHILVPVGTGGSEARRLAKRAANLFRGTTLLDGDLEFMDASIGMGAPADDDGNWWRVSVSIDWRRMEA